MSYTKKVQKICKQCNLDVDDVKQIAKLNNIVEMSDLYYTLEQMLEKNEIKIGGN